MDEIRFRLEGIPATYLSDREKAWRAAIEDQAKKPSLGGVERGLRMRFTLPTFAANVKPVVLPELVEPVLAVLVTRVGWFDSKRANVLWWVATKEQSTPQGCEVAISPAEPEASWKSLHEAVFPGPLPRGSSDPVLVDWALKHPFPARSVPSRLALRLDFADTSLSIADAAGGKLKAVIDGLHPWLGGDIRTPAGHHLDRLFVTKGLPGLAPGSVRILVDRA